MLEISKEAGKRITRGVCEGVLSSANSSPTFVSLPNPLFGSTPQVPNLNLMISTIFKVVTPHCTFRNLTGGAVVVTTCMVLRRSNSLETFVNAFKEAVLPFGNFLRALSEGSIRFTVQAENVSALDALWQSYQDETLQKKLQEFLVTEEIKQLAGSEVMLTVHIDEDEYRNAMWDLMISETEGNYTFNGPATIHDFSCEMN